MTDDATTNLGLSGSDSAQPSDSSIDNPANWNFADPDEDQDNHQNLASEAVDNSETDEAEGQEADQSETETETEGEGEAKDLAATDDVTVTLPTGDKVPLGELKNGYLRQQDYTHKTTEVANQRRELETVASRVNGTVEALSNFLVQQLPPKPDQALAFSDPQEHYRQSVIYNEAVKQVEAILQAGTAAKEAVNAISEQQRMEALKAEDAKLAQVMPITTNPEGRRKFFESAFEAARELGYADNEINAVTDHRAFVLAHYAKIGIAAERARKTAQTKVANVPPMQAPRRQAQPSSSTAMKNKQAMSRLAKTGSIHDAVNIDFD